MLVYIFFTMAIMITSCQHQSYDGCRHEIKRVHFSPDGSIISEVEEGGLTVEYNDASTLHVTYSTSLRYMYIKYIFRNKRLINAEVTERIMLNTDGEACEEPLEKSYKINFLCKSTKEKHASIEKLGYSVHTALFEK